MKTDLPISQTPTTGVRVGRSVSVVVPHYNDLANLALCVASLARQTYPKHLWKLIVVDNDSPQGLDAVRDVVGADGVVLLAREKGAWAARNIGVEATDTECLAFLDSDCTAHPEWLTRGIARLTEKTVVTGPINVFERDVGTLTPSEAFEKQFAFRNDIYVRKGFCVTASLFVERAVFEKTGRFRPKVAEDKDWGLRASAGGVQFVFDPEVIINHPARHTLTELFRKWRRLTQESLALASEKRFGVLSWWIRSLLLPLSVPVGACTTLVSRRLPHLRDKAAAILALSLVRMYRFWLSQTMLIDHITRRAS